MLFQLIVAIVKRSEFLLENCGFVDAHPSLDPQIHNQLVQYIFLLKLSLLYTPHAIIKNAAPSREFVFAIISASLIRIPEYRICFLTQLQSTIKNTGVEPDAGVETIAFSTTTSTFIDKYIDPSLLRSAAPLNLPTSSSRLSGLLSDSLRVSLPRTTPLSGISAETGSADERPAGEAGEGESLAGVEEDFPSFVSEAIEEQSIDFKTMVANIPPAFVLRSDQIVFHDDLPATPQDSHEFCFDDHNFDHINYDDDYSENPYSTMNIHDIVRDHLYSLNYSLTGRFADRDTGSELPPLKLPNMNVVVDLMYERCRESVEERLMCRRYEAAHPSLFRWDRIDASEVDEESMYINQKQFQSNESAGESEEEKESGFESIGDLYLDTQIVDVLGRSRVLLAQFLSYYIDYVRELNGPKDSVCWTVIPGYFLVMRLFLIHFQDFYMSKLSGGILRLNLNGERLIKDSIAYALCDSCVVNGEILNSVMSILFDKCNVNVFLDISKTMMVLHNLLKAVRKRNRILNYHAYSPEFYARVYSSREIQLLLFLQQSFPAVPLVSTVSTHFSSPLSCMSARSSPVPADDIPDLDLPLFDTLSHSNYYYNQNQSIIYSQGNALDLLYETTIDSTIRRKESLTHSKAIPAEWTGALALAQRENDESRGNAQLSRSSPAGETLKKENRDSDEIPAEIRPSAREIPAGNVDSVHEKTAGNEEMAAGTKVLLLSPPDLPPKTAGAVEEEPRELCTECQRTAVYSTFRGKGAGFTQLQAIQFLLENNVITSRGEGLDFLSLLQSRRMLEPIKYERRFRTTLFHVIQPQQLQHFAYPEISPYNHGEFEDKLNYVYLIYALKQLIAMPHLQILQKVITFLYYNEDFFNGAHRLLLFREIVFPNFVQFFTHWSPNIRHLFHRLLLYKLFRTRLSYLPHYSSVEIHNELYSKIFNYRKWARSQPAEPRANDESNLFSFDHDMQQQIFSQFNYDRFQRAQTQRAVKARLQKVAMTMELGLYRETQNVDGKLAEILKSNLHILLSIGNTTNPNRRQGKYCVPPNQMRYYWESFAEFISLLYEYEKKEASMKANPFTSPNVYNSGVGTVSGTAIPWTTVNEMESKIPDENSDIEFFLAYKQ